MGCDMVVALGKATVQENTLFGINYHGPGRHVHSLQRLVGRSHAPDEVLRLGPLQLPEVRQTCTVLGNQPQGSWGLTHGINEHRVVAGFCRWQSKVPPSQQGLSGAELIRLTLERSHSATQALDVLTNLVGRYGQRAASGWEESADHIFLIADGREAFIVEAAGPYWASLECPQVRAASDVGLIRQDWRRLAPGMADFVISQGWWADDGSKLDVAGSLGEDLAQKSGALKRWGKATLLLEQQNGHIDHHFLRQLLNEHYEGTVSTKDSGTLRPAHHLQASFIAAVSSQEGILPMAWCACGPENAPLYFPVFLQGDLPTSCQIGSGEGTYVARKVIYPRLQERLEDSSLNRESLEKLQMRFDQETEDFLNQARTHLQKGNKEQVTKLASTLMQNHAELLEAELRQLPSGQLLGAH
jgi:hypothetical protein